MPYGKAMWQGHMARPYGKAIWQSHMGEPYGNAIWQSHMAKPYGEAIWLWQCHMAAAAIVRASEPTFFQENLP